MSLEKLPQKVLTRIFSFLDTSSVFALASLNKAMRKNVKEAIHVLPHVCVSVNEEQSLFRKLIESVPNLREIHLNHSLHLTDELITLLVQKCSKIEVLDLWNCLSLTSVALSQVSNLKNLRWLSIGDNENFDDDSLEKVINNCPDLEYLDITLCTKISDSVAETIAEKSKKLKALVAEFCPDFSTDTTLRHLSAGNTVVLEKIVMGNGKVSDNGIEHLTHSPFKAVLKSADFRRNVEITFHGYDSISQDFPSINEIDGILTSSLPEHDVGNHFINKRLMTGEG